MLAVGGADLLKVQLGQAGKVRQPPRQAPHGCVAPHAEPCQALQRRDGCRQHPLVLQPGDLCAGRRLDNELHTVGAKLHQPSARECPGQTPLAATTDVVTHLDAQGCEAGQVLQGVIGRQSRPVGRQVCAAGGQDQQLPELAEACAVPSMHYLAVEC
jgi:hypothetical protein